MPLSTVIGAPISTWLIENGDGVLGFEQGWRFMFFAEGVPAVLVGFLVLVLLPDRPTKARWLTAEQAQALESTIAAEDAAEVPGHTGMREALRDGRVVGPTRPASGGGTWRCRRSWGRPGWVWPCSWTRRTW